MKHWETSLQHSGAAQEFATDMLEGFSSAIEECLEYIHSLDTLDEVSDAILVLASLSQSLCNKTQAKPPHPHIIQGWRVQYRQLLQQHPLDTVKQHHVLASLEDLLAQSKESWQLQESQEPILNATPRRLLN